MVIKQGTILTINHSRYGIFQARATRNFDRDDNWYPVVVADGERVQGETRAWCSGDSIPCRKALVTHLEVAA